MDLINSCVRATINCAPTNVRMHTRINLAVGQYLLPIWIPLPSSRSPSLAIPLSCGQSRRWFRFARTNPVIRTDQTGFACRFPMSRREFDRFLPYPDRRWSPAGAIAERCVRAGPLNRARMSCVTAGIRSMRADYKIDTPHQVSAITDTCPFANNRKKMHDVCSSVSRMESRNVNSRLVIMSVDDASRFPIPLFGASPRHITYNNII